MLVCEVQNQAPQRMKGAYGIQRVSLSCGHAHLMELENERLRIVLIPLPLPSSC
jgi:hypothetical protein